MSFFSDEEMKAINKKMREGKSKEDKDLLNMHSNKLGKKADVSNKASQPAKPKMSAAEKQRKADAEYYRKRQAENKAKPDTRSLESIGSYDVPSKNKAAAPKKATEGETDTQRYLRGLDKQNKNKTSRKQYF